MLYQRIVATRQGGPEVLEVVEEELPELEPGEVRIRVQAAGVLLADVLWQQGKVPGSPRLPFTPGYDVVGVVDQVGEELSVFHEGQKVAALIQYGGYAEYANVSAEKVVPVPEGLDPAEVVCLTVGYLTATQIFHRVADLKPGQRVLVHGAAGGTGSAMVDLGRQMGLEMYGTASKAKHDLVNGLGAIAIDYKNEDFVQRIFDLTGDGVDLVVDPIGGPNLKRSFKTLRPGGLLISTAAIAVIRGDVSPMGAVGSMLRFPIWNLWPNKKRAQLFDVVGYSRERRDEYAADLRRLMHLLSDGEIKPVIAGPYPLEEARQAQEQLLDFKVQGKIVLINEEKL